MARRVLLFEFSVWLRWEVKEGEVVVVRAGGGDVEEDRKFAECVRGSSSRRSHTQSR